MDALAANFSVDADDDCCCEYPDLIFNVKHLYDSINFDLGQTYLNQFDQTFIPLDLYFHISDVALLRDDQWFTVDDRISLTTGQVQTFEEPDDVTIFTRSGFRFAIGRFLNPGLYSKVRFSIGLNEPEMNVDVKDLDDGHPLDTASNNLWLQEEGYLKYFAQLVTDTTTRDTLNLISLASPSISIELSIEAVKERGDDLTIGLIIDYRHWFFNLDFLNDSDEMIREKIEDGIGNSLFVLD